MTRIRTLLARLIGRDPVMVTAVVIGAAVAALPLLHWSAATTGAVTAVLMALNGVISAALLEIDRALPLLVGLAKSVLAALLTFGVHVPENYSTAVMAFLTFVAALATRPQVGAKEPPRDRDGREVDRNGWPVGELDVTTERTQPDVPQAAEQRQPMAAPPTVRHDPYGDPERTATIEPPTGYRGMLGALDAAVQHESRPQPAQHNRGRESTGRHHLPDWGRHGDLGNEMGGAGA